MSNSSPSGFISKKQATRRYRRSARQLTRDITEAIALGKEQTLTELVLRTDDGTFHDAASVTLDGIKEMKAAGRNPMWFVREDWMAEKFGARSKGSDIESDPDDVPIAGTHKPRPPDVDQEQGSHFSTDYVELLREQNRDLKQDKDKLLSLIDELTEHQKQSNVLTKDLHSLLADRQGAILTLSEQTSPIVDSQIATADKPSNNVARKRKVNSARSAQMSTKKKTASSARNKKPAQRKKKSLFETATPTLHKLFSRR